ncbi:hypothetical protein C8R44DRAFT_824821 [Mycena epipterygia]|nr:hypothetical protein C8R44DRAFT_824821 [Mycena epipterygia]
MKKGRHPAHVRLVFLLAALCVCALETACPPQQEYPLPPQPLRSSTCVRLAQPPCPTSIRVAEGAASTGVRAAAPPALEPVHAREGGG